MLTFAQGQLADAKTPADVKKAQASVALYQKRIGELHQQQAPLAAFSAEVAAWAAAHDPWSPMSDDDWAHLAGLWKGATRFPLLTGYHGDPGMDAHAQKMFDALPAETDPRFVALPDHVQDVIRARRAPRPQWWNTARLFADALEAQAINQYPRALAKLREKLVEAQKRLGVLQPRSTFGAIFGKAQPKPKEILDLETQIAANEAQSAEIERERQEIVGLASEIRGWVAGRDPWSMMSAADAALLAERHDRVRKRSKSMSYALSSLEQFETMTMLSLASGEERAYATLPQSVRDMLNEKGALPITGGHRMFGRPMSIQDSAASLYEEGNILLLQLVYDDVLHWNFGDNGAYTFFISPADLARRDWASVRMVFECH